MRESLALRAPAGLRLAFCAASEASRLIEDGLAAWLTPGETAQWQALASPKRQLDWVCGRVAAKRALGSAETEIANDPTGRPYVRLPDSSPAPAISISHCAEGGVCAASDEHAVGVDYETVAEREGRLLELYVHPEERALARGAEAQTALWSLKEAVLKLLGLGLAGGLTDVRFPSGAANNPPALHGAAERRWQELGRPKIETSWRREGPAVLALAWAPQGA